MRRLRHLIIDRSLWERSGHWDKFKEHMFMAKGDDEKVLALKPELSVTFKSINKV